MARVPIAEIPNAPQAGGNPVTSRGPGAAPDITSSAGSLIQSTINPQAFSGTAQAMASVGAAVAGAGGKVAGVLNDWAERRQKAQDLTIDAQIDAEWYNLTADVTKQTANLPGDQWEPTFTKAFQERQKNFSALLDTASPEARAKFEADMVRREAATRNQFAVDGSKRAFSDGREAILSAARRDFVSGNYESGFGRLGKAKDAGFITDTEFQNEQFSAEQQARDSRLYQWLNIDPKGFAEYTARVAKEGKPDGDIQTPEQARLWASRAKSQWEGVQVDTRKGLHDAILAGEITSEADLRKRAAGNLGETEIKSLTKAMFTEIQYDSETATKLNTDIENADFSTPKGADELNSLQTRIETTIPKRLQGAFSSRLFQNWNASRDGKTKTPEQKYSASLMSFIDKLADDGVLGDTGKDKKGKVVDKAKNAALWTDAETYKEQMRAWLRDNPRANPDEAQKQLNSIMGARLKDGAAARVKSAWTGSLLNTLGDWASSAANGMSESRFRSNPPPTLEDLKKQADSVLQLPEPDPTNADPDQLIK
ncbi:hypothetical protein TSACC_3693 [Terrimicrobium sacchariphilum]|uniref:Uncharacterized protein n=1 Tax=Terrimicrobium sacchariphilum TaxID=690879 RepID=A0A146GES6_TERSA|nr:hypothetical protein [Terrimicrobium sacchariphilum]GAT35622.1 hypothetical protein TSACC_3693 [Terrimicrobium sacchariphilum]